MNWDKCLPLKYYCYHPSMKIAVFHNLPSGGAKRALFNYCKYLSKLGHKLYLTIPATANEEYLPIKEFFSNVKIFPVYSCFPNMAGFYSRNHLVNPLFMTSKIIRQLIALDRCQREIAGFIDKEEIDVVFAEQCGFSYSPFLFRYIKKPGIYFCQQPRRTQEAILQRLDHRHDNDVKFRSHHLFKDSFDKKNKKLIQIESENASFADLILTNSYYTRETILRQYGLDARVCYLGVDEGRFQPLYIQKEDFILSVGAIHGVKGFDFLISSISRIDKKIRPRVLLVGNSCDQKEKEYLTHLALKKGVDLEIKIFITDDELITLYNKAKVFVYASYLEPFGLGVLEAMACGTPVVAVKEGGVREIVIDGMTGILVDRDEKLFADAVESLLIDKDQREGMGSHSVKIVQERWTLEKAGDRLMNYINKLLGL